jgi:hypothetical protein
LPAGERNIARRSAGEPNGVTEYLMPIYACFHGDCGDLASQLPGRSPFSAPDTLGRQWLCCATDLEHIPGGLPAVEAFKSQLLANRLRGSARGDEVKIFKCPDDDSLRRQLLLATRPTHYSHTSNHK